MNLLTYAGYLLLTTACTLFTCYWLSKILVASIKGYDPSTVLPDIKALRKAKSAQIMAKLERDKRQELLG